MIIGYLQVGCWQGFGGHHWYGTIQFLYGKRPSIEVRHKITTREAKALNEKDRVTSYKKGFKSGRFEEERHLIETAIEAAKENGLDILIRGNTSSCDPALILHGPEPLMSELNVIQARCEEIGYWDHREHKAEMERLADEWEAKLKAAQ